MKYFLSLLLLANIACAEAQSPQYVIELNIKDTAHYTIAMKFCEPLKKTHYTNWFDHPVTKINWTKLQSQDYTCKNYDTGNYKNQFRQSNNDMLWEDILVFKITPDTNVSIAPMYIIVPVKIKAFVTFIYISDVVFKPGIYELENMQTEFRSMVLQMKNIPDQIWKDKTNNRKFKVSLE